MQHSYGLIGKEKFGGPETVWFALIYLQRQILNVEYMLDLMKFRSCSWLTTKVMEIYFSKMVYARILYLVCMKTLQYKYELCIRVLVPFIFNTSK